MTSWHPEPDSARPRYLAIAEALAADIAAGRLKPGDRLPSHRDLAWKLKVTVGTVTRAYREAERRGLTIGEVGRGSFVAPPITPGPYQEAAALAQRSDFVNMVTNVASSRSFAAEVAENFRAVAEEDRFADLLDYQPSLGRADQLATAADWLSTFGLTVEPSELALTNGANHAAMLAMTALVRSGDTLLCEPVMFYGMKALARMLDLKLHGVAMDEEGILPEALDSACRSTGARLLYVVPNLQNPTTAVMSDARRAAIAEVCRRHEVWVVEDDIYAFLLTGPGVERPAPLASYLPDQTFYTNSLSKIGMQGLRVGFLRFPPKLRSLIENGIRGSSMSANGLTHAVGQRLIENGVVQRAIDLQRQEAQARQVIAGRCLAGLKVQTHPNSMYLWLHLPAAWSAERFALAAERAGVGVLAASTISCDRNPTVEAVRVSLSGAPDRQLLESALLRLRDLAMQEEPALHFAAI